ncbi:hypothetical protein M432DRAFT_426847 [Thermoascus aurantiacus ATCC 26904]
MLQSMARVFRRQGPGRCSPGPALSLLQPQPSSGDELCVFSLVSAVIWSFVFSLVSATEETHGTRARDLPPACLRFRRLILGPHGAVGRHLLCHIDIEMILQIQYSRSQRRAWNSGQWTLCPADHPSLHSRLRIQHPCPQPSPRAPVGQGTDALSLFSSQVFSLLDKNSHE